MRKLFPATFFLFFCTLHAHAQIGAMKLVGPGTKDYSIGVGAFIKGSIPASDAPRWSKNINQMLAQE